MTQFFSLMFCVTDKPFITISGTEKVFCGEIARFKVIVSPKDLGGWSVKWQKLNGDVSTHIDLNKEKYSRPTDRELIIHSVCREDDGIYQAYLSQESNGSNFKVLGNALCLQTVGGIVCFLFFDTLYLIKIIKKKTIETCCTCRTASVRSLESNERKRRN